MTIRRAIDGKHRPRETIVQSLARQIHALNVAADGAMQRALTGQAVEGDRLVLERALKVSTFLVGGAL